MTPLPFWNFSENSSVLVTVGFPKWCKLFQLTVRWVSGLVGVSAQRLAMAESDTEAGMSYSSRWTTVFHVQTELRLKSATQNVVQVGMKTFKLKRNLVYAKLNYEINFQLTVRWAIGLVGVSVQRLAMVESDPEAEILYSSRCTTGFNVQTELRLKSATQNFVQVVMKTLKLKTAWFMPS